MPLIFFFCVGGRHRPPQSFPSEHCPDPCLTTKSRPLPYNQVQTLALQPISYRDFSQPINDHLVLVSQSTVELAKWWFRIWKEQFPSLIQPHWEFLPTRFHTCQPIPGRTKVPTNQSEVLFCRWWKCCWARFLSATWEILPIQPPFILNSHSCATFLSTNQRSCSLGDGNVAESDSPRPHGRSFQPPFILNSQSCATFISTNQRSCSLGDGNVAESDSPRPHGRSCWYCRGRPLSRLLKVFFLQKLNQCKFTMFSGSKNLYFPLS